MIMGRVRILLRKMDRVLQRFLYRDFYRIKLKADGMLSPRVYARIYERVRATPDLDVLEIGSGRGAGTVVIAKALKDAGKTAKVIAVEKFEGGSNVAFGTKDENLLRVHDLFEHFSVTDKITIFPEYLSGSNIRHLVSLISDERLSCVVIDADGRLNVYLPALWEHLSDDCEIILDDYRESYDFREKSEQYPLGHTKELLCYRLVNRLVELGYIKIDKVVESTVFARKGSKQTISDADLAALDEQAASVERDHEQWLRNRGGSAASMSPNGN
jgi:predicted O-methyltransferase YrrM